MSYTPIDDYEHSGAMSRVAEVVVLTRHRFGIIYGSFNAIELVVRQVEFATDG